MSAGRSGNRGGHSGSPAGIGGMSSVHRESQGEGMDRQSQDSLLKNSATPRRARTKLEQEQSSRGSWGRGGAKRHMAKPVCTLGTRREST